MIAGIDVEITNAALRALETGEAQSLTVNGKRFVIVPMPPIKEPKPEPPKADRWPAFPQLPADRRLMRAIAIVAFGLALSVLLGLGMGIGW